ncbi:hypothetical protein N656DRAFT_52536 [Canariomyces notabilis]|uniref:Uncharacterized protein n=1 Tax=Canariomyces notabilis TaxID=2074819 RepID=A0AAN6YYP6_9PEZI|nr:hypothetical protein N656DRAFT_52536 [Canariomyces arenarius]
MGIGRWHRRASAEVFTDPFFSNERGLSCGHPQGLMTPFSFMLLTVPSDNGLSKGCRVSQAHPQSSILTVSICPKVYQLFQTRFDKLLSARWSLNTQLPPSGPFQGLSLASEIKIYHDVELRVRDRPLAISDLLLSRLLVQSAERASLADFANNKKARALHISPVKGAVDFNEITAQLHTPLPLTRSTVHPSFPLPTTHKWLPVGRASIRDHKRTLRLTARRIPLEPCMIR